MQTSWGEMLLLTQPAGLPAFVSIMWSQEIFISNVQIGELSRALNPRLTGSPFGSGLLR